MNERLLDIPDSESSIQHHFSIEQSENTRRSPKTEEDWRQIEYDVYTSKEMKFKYYVQWFADHVWTIFCWLFKFLMIIMPLELVVNFQYLPESLFDKTRRVFWSLLIIWFAVFIITGVIEMWAWKRVLRLWEKLGHI